MCRPSTYEQGNKVDQVLKKDFKRFVDKYTVDNKTGCWNWDAAKTKTGYGHFRFNGSCHQAHRVSYLLFKGDFDKEKSICHKCDNPACVNPDHLWVGTHEENMLDSISKNRMAFQKEGFVSLKTGKTKYDVMIKGQGMIKTACSRCGKNAFYVFQSTYQPKHRFCSRTCSAIYFNKLGRGKKKNDIV